MLAGFFIYLHQLTDYKQKTMKQKLLLIICLITLTSWGKSTTVNPSIGITASAFASGPGIFLYSINIKNTGDETLTNVYVTDFIVGPTSQFSFSTFASLAPGEEITNLQALRSGYLCFDQCQFQVHATTASNTEITDLSSDVFQGGNYYNDSTNQISYELYIQGSQEGIYTDLNNNSIVDIGDAVNYTYTIGNTFGAILQVNDNNAIVTNPILLGSPAITTGIHYLTQADVDLGYVYNQSYTSIVDTGGNPCLSTFPFQDTTPCFTCPNPNNANIVTQLTSLLPNKISGTVKLNTNNDNCVTGSNFPYRRISTTDGNYTYASYSNTAGDYHILIPNIGNYTTNALTNLNANFSSNPASVAVTSSGSGVDYNNTDFCIGSAANYTDLSINMFNINQAIPGNIATYGIYYSNNGSTALSGSIQVTYDNGKLTLASASPVQNSATANTLTWNYTTLLPFETRYISLSLNVLTPPTVNTGDILAFTINGPTAGDNVPADNTLTWNQTVRSSFDPNDKTVIEGNSISLSQAGNYLTYITRFQNTGTANATTVVIKDTLDPKLDWNTFEPIASSHPSNIQIQNGSDVTYTFSNIDLAFSSANEPASHGWMAYRIKPKSTVTIGDIMTSGSAIYFDYNPPIQTNDATTEVTALATTDFIKSNFLVYPNPAANYIIIGAKTNIESSYQITDTNGKLLLSGVTQVSVPIDIRSLQSGFYFLTVKTTEGNATFKLIKN